MHEIHYVTSNIGKFNEVNEFMKRQDTCLKIKQYTLEIAEIQTLDQRAVALDKARQAWECLQKPILVDDAGFYFEKYNHFPGVLSKFIYQALGLEGIFKLVQPGDKAYFQLVLVYYYGVDRYELFEGRCEGEIVYPTVFDTASSLPYVFLFKPHGVSEALDQLKIKGQDELYNPRVIALKKFLQWYSCI